MAYFAKKMNGRHLKISVHYPRKRQLTARHEHFIGGDPPTTIG
jgi:hypothetical protein